MNGFKKLSETERREMSEDGRNGLRKQAFLAARNKAREGSLDDYIDFLSENMEMFKAQPTARKTEGFRL